ncbi:unnamed protein product [Penicillium pancosmium]
MPTALTPMATPLLDETPVSNVLRNPPAPMSTNSSSLPPVSSTLNVTSIASNPGPAPAPAPSPSSLNHASYTAAAPEAPSGTVVIVYQPGQEHIVHMVAEVLGKPWTTEIVLSTLSKADVVVAGVVRDNLDRSLEGCDREAVVLVNTHSVEDGSAPDDALSERCDYEFLYSRTPFLRRDLTRFLSLILGQTRPHEDLRTKTRTNFISTTFPDVHAALPNLDILSVGSDAVEIRVDLLVEPECEGKVPSLKCIKENGKFPMDDPALFFKYLRRAIQWGVEYVDVELWLPEDIRRALAEVKGNSIIMSAFHDFSGSWKWTSSSAVEIFNESAKYSDIVKMIAMVSTIEENYELEYFRSTIKSRGAGHPLLSAVNMGQMGQLSRALNTVFSPITHPLLPMIAAPGQLTAAEINEALHIMGQLPKRDLYAIGSFRSTPQSMFMEKCMNELGLPHSFTCIDRGPKGSMESVLLHPQFGGASLNPPVPASTSYIPSISDAARAIGLIDTIAATSNPSSSSPSPPPAPLSSNPMATPSTPTTTFIGENSAWKGIRATLTRDYVPSAYKNRAAIILSGTESDASATIFALRSLGVGSIYTVGFKAHGPLAAGLEPFTSIQSVKLVESPFVIVSALPPEKSLLVQPLLRHYRSNGRSSPTSTRGKVYLDLTSGARKGDPLAVARAAGWTAYGAEDVTAWTTVETLRLLVGQNVPFDFVRMASGRSLF